VDLPGGVDAAGYLRPTIISVHCGHFIVAPRHKLHVESKTGSL